MHCSLFETESFYLSPMIINVVALAEPVHDFSYEIPAAEMNLEEDTARMVKPARIAGNLKRGIAQTEVEGRVAGEIEIDCARCLKPNPAPLDLAFKVAFVTEENYTQDAEAELRHADLEVSVYDGENIDLAELAREQIVLNLSERFLCREDCLGLCPKCGVDKNAVNCNCEEKEIDPRWSALKDLK